MQILNLMNDFLDWNQSGAVNKYNYKRAIIRLSNEASIEDLNDLELKIKNYFSSKIHLDPTTFNGYRRNLNVFFEYLRKHGHISRNPIDLIPSRRHKTEEGFTQDEHQIKVLPREMIELILQRIKKYEELNFYYTVLLLAETGARPIEVCRLFKTSLEGDLVNFKYTKTGSPRSVFINHYVASQVSAWSKSHDSKFLLSGQNGKMQRSDTLSKVFRRNSAGLLIPETNEQPTLYCLRHTKATELADLLPLPQAAKLLGMSIHTMNRYYGFTKKHSAEAYEKVKHLSYAA